MAAVDVSTTPVPITTTSYGVLSIYNEGPGVVYYDSVPAMTADTAMGVIEVGDTYTNSAGYTYGAERWVVCKTGTARVRVLAYA